MATRHEALCSATQTQQMRNSCRGPETERLTTGELFSLSAPRCIWVYFPIELKQPLLERDITILHLLSFRVNPIQKPMRTGQYGGGEEQEMLTYGPESYVPGDRYINLP